MPNSSLIVQNYFTCTETSIELNNRASLKSPDTAVSFASLQAFRAEVLRSSPSRLGILRREEHERRASSQFRKKGERGVFSGASVRQSLLPDRWLLPFPRPHKREIGRAHV